MCDSHRKFGGKEEGGVAVAEPPRGKRPKKEWQSDEGGDNSAEVEAPPERRPLPAPAKVEAQVHGRARETLGDTVELDPAQRKLGGAGESGARAEKSKPAPETSRPVPALPDETERQTAAMRAKLAVAVTSKLTPSPRPTSDAKRPDQPTPPVTRPTEAKKPSAPVRPLEVKKPVQPIRPQQSSAPRTTPVAPSQLTPKERMEKRLTTICQEEKRQGRGNAYYSWRAQAANMIAMVLGTTQLPSGVEARRKMENMVFNQLRNEFTQLGIDEEKWPMFLKRGS
ncbi:MAG: hypothetical protein PHH13_01320 [Candidatus Peribacteraceae bacterium]|nr:hypothetical protein [Candidatus Peribacteraceae bacterium]